jgi:ribonuclease BN (tRNA processing enzyme)
MRVIFLGTNGWYDSPTGNTVCTLIDTDGATIILDAGFGIFKLGRHVDFDKPAYLFLSHVHLDHIAGLHTLCKFIFKKGLTICGEQGIESTLRRIIDFPYTVPIDGLPFSTRFVELPGAASSLPFAVKSLPLVHAAPCLGFRLEIENKIVAYCTDTGYCENAVELGRDADLLITECAMLTGEEFEAWPHLNPETAARIAREAGAKRLALFHFDAEHYNTLEERERAQAIATEHFPNVIAAKDDLTIDL